MDRTTANDGCTGAALAGGIGGSGSVSASIVRQRPAEVRTVGGASAGPWPTWARVQLAAAAALVEEAPDELGTARLLYRDWFSPVVDAEADLRQRPLVGMLRAAHAGSARRVDGPDLSVVDRFDLIGPDGWWRTWGTAWTPPRRRRGSVRLILTPRTDRLADLVTTVTAALLPTGIGWSFGCATRARRLARRGAAVLDVPSLVALPAGLLDQLEPLLHPVTPPLCLPVRPGVGVAEYPDNGMTFGEHRCHLVALALRHPSGARNPLRSIAAVFTAHGIDPAAPHRSR
jgi:hypothetical protein